MTGYLTFKTIHVLAAIVFVGNIVVTGVWKGLADRTRSREVITFAQRLVTITDYLFTGGGAVVVLMTGLLMMRSYERTVLEIPWLFWGIALFAVSGTIWLAALVPIQRKQTRLLRESGEEIPDAYWRLARAWTLWGTIATVLPLISVYVMVFKPV